MHYCQECDDSPLMDPHEDGVARCRRCGSVDLAAKIHPLLVVVGASASGKTTILPRLAQQLSGQCVVFDADWLIDPLGGDVTTLDWDLLRDIWLHVAHGVAQNGLPTLRLGALLPDQLNSLGGRRWIGDLHFLLLDCDDEERRRRIDARPSGRTHDVEPQVAFARWLRDNFTTVIDTTDATADEAATQVADWARGVLAE